MYSKACVLEHALGHTSPNGMSWDSEQRFWRGAEFCDLEMKSSDNLDFIFSFGEIFTAHSSSVREQHPNPLNQLDRWCLRLLLS